MKNTLTDKNKCYLARILAIVTLDQQKCFATINQYLNQLKKFVAPSLRSTNHGNQAVKLVMADHFQNNLSLLSFM